MAFDKTADINCVARCCQCQVLVAIRTSRFRTKQTWLNPYLKVTCLQSEPPLLEAGGASKRTDAVKRIRTYGPKREALGAATSAERWGPASHTVW